MWRNASFLRRCNTALLRRYHLISPVTSTSPFQRLRNRQGAANSNESPSNVIVRWQSTGDAPTIISITFLQPDGQTRKTVEARVGESLLQTAHRNDIELEGACEGTLEFVWHCYYFYCSSLTDWTATCFPTHKGVCACSTCHLIFPVAIYDSLPEPSEDEEDMLDMAFGLTETSRLGCQITVTEQMDGMLLEMPKATRNFYVDGHVPKPH